MATTLRNGLAPYFDGDLGNHIKLQRGSYSNEVGVAPTLSGWEQ